MKRALLPVVMSLLGAPIQAQQATQAQQQVVRVECRDLAAGNYIAPNETLINGKACRPAGATLQMVATPKLTPTEAASPSQSQSLASPATLPSGPAPPSDAKKDVVQQSVNRQCLILKRMGPADQVTSHLYSFGIRGKQFQYVEGDFPTGAKFHGRLTDHDVRNIQSHGGRVVIMEPKYSPDDLREAKQSCKEQ